MSAILSSVEVFLQDGFTYAILAMGYYISYIILDFPDLTVEGTVAFVVGALFGALTGVLHVKLGIRPLLCGILVSTGLISINLVASVMGMGGNIRGEDGLTTIPVGRSISTILNTHPCDWIPSDMLGFGLRKVLTFLIVALIFKLIMDFFFKTKSGLLLRATGNNAQFVSMLAKTPGTSKILGLAIANGFAAVTGALIVQSRGNANQSMGIGMVVIGLASVIIGVSLFQRIRWMKPSTMVIIGALIYQACLAVATLLGVPTAYNKLVMAILFTVALVVSNQLKKKGGVHRA